MERGHLHAYENLELPEKDVWGVLMRKDHPLATKRHIRPNDLRKLALISSRQTQVADFLSQWLGYDYGELNIVATYNLIFNATLMIAQGMGVALVLDKLANTGDDSLFTFRPFEPTLQVLSYLAWKKYRPMSKAAAPFLNRVNGVLG